MRRTQFNSLISVKGLHSLRHLRSVNLNHNALKSASLAPLAQLPSLHTLKLSHNQLTSLTPLGRCGALVELWVPHNLIADLADLAALRPCSQVRSGSVRCGLVAARTRIDVSMVLVRPMSSVRKRCGVWRSRHVLGWKLPADEGSPHNSTLNVTRLAVGYA